MLASVVGVALAGCPHPTRGSVMPAVPTGGDGAARSRFVEAQRVFEAARSDDRPDVTGDAAPLDGATGADFLAIASTYADDPIAPLANLYAGMALVREGAFADAVAPLAAAREDDGGDRKIEQRATLMLGLAKTYLGDHTAARGLLVAGEVALDGDAERVEWHAAMAATHAAGPTPLEALSHYDAFYASATAVERAYIVAQVEALVAGAADADLETAWRAAEGRRGPAAASLAYRLAAVVEAAGDGGRARALRDGALALRQSVGLPTSASATPAPSTAGGGDPGLLGAALPATGKGARVGELAQQGMVAAVRAGGDDGAITIDQRAATGADDAAASIDALAAAGVIGIVGPIDAAAVDAAAARAEALGVPMLSLSPRPEERAAGEWVFHVMHSAEARARALARKAVDGGVTTFAVLAPDSGYGRAVSAAFTAEVAALGGKVVETDTYAADTKSFASAASKLGKGWDALLVPDQADKLELLVPALATAGLPVRALGAKAGSSRSIVLLSTAEGVAADFLVDAGRHSLGALLAPGFYPDLDDEAIGAFVRGYQREFGGLPTAVEAYAFDAAQLVQRSGAAGRGDLRRKLAAAAQVGVTGTISFAGSRRTDDGVMYEVVKVAAASGGAVTYALRARR